jgi:hypothetical protein
MDSYLKGRSKAQRFHAAIPSPKNAAGLPAAKTVDEKIVRAESEEGVENAPQVDLVLRGGVVRRIVVHLEDGRRLELECSYEGDEEEE